MHKLCNRYTNLPKIRVPATHTGLYHNANNIWLHKLANRSAEHTEDRVPATATVIYHNIQLQLHKLA